MLADSHVYFHRAADVLGLSDKVRTILLTPFRSVKVEVAIEGEDEDAVQPVTPHLLQPLIQGLDQGQGSCAQHIPRVREKSQGDGART